MLKLTIPQQAAEEPIDWSKPQWVIDEDSHEVVLTSGWHEGSIFSGTCMPCTAWPNGKHTIDWDKNDFRPLTIDIPFTISNND